VVTTEYLIKNNMRQEINPTSSEFNPELQSKEIRKFSKDLRKAKIQKLKLEIKAAQDNVATKLSNLDLKEELKLTPEEQETKKASFKEMLELNKVNIKSLKDELNLTRLNKNSSKFFEWLPTLANRRMRRVARKLRNV
jgi:hypothetical protein